MLDLSSNENFWNSGAEILAYSYTFNWELKNFNLSRSISTSFDNGSSTILTLP